MATAEHSLKASHFSKKFGSVYVHLSSDGRVGISPVLEGVKPPKAKEAEFWIEDDQWKAMSKWAIDIRRGTGLEPPPPGQAPAIMPYHPTPWWVHLLTLGLSKWRIEGIVRKQYRGGKKR